MKQLDLVKMILVLLGLMTFSGCIVSDTDKPISGRSTMIFPKKFVLSLVSGFKDYDVSRHKFESYDDYYYALDDGRIRLIRAYVRDNKDIFIQVTTKKDNDKEKAAISDLVLYYYAIEVEKNRYQLYGIDNDKFQALYSELRSRVLRQAASANEVALFKRFDGIVAQGRDTKITSSENLFAILDLLRSVANSNKYFTVEGVVDIFPLAVSVSNQNGSSASAQSGTKNTATSQQSSIFPCSKPPCPAHSENDLAKNGNGVSAGKNSAASHMQIGKEAFKKNDMTTAMEYLLPLAKNGNAEAQAYVGIIYGDGAKDTKKNTKEALKWLSLSAAAGNASGELAYGNLLSECNLNVFARKGESIFFGCNKEKMPEALKWIRSAAKKNHQEAVEILPEYEKAWQLLNK